MISDSYIKRRIQYFPGDGRAEIRMWHLIVLLKGLGLQGTYRMAKVLDHYCDKASP